VIYVHTVYMHEHLHLFLHTHWVASDDSGFAHPDIGSIHVIVQVFDELVQFTRSWEFFSIDYGILIFFSFLFSFIVSCILDLVFTLILYLYDIMHGCLYMILQ